MCGGFWELCEKCHLNLLQLLMIGGVHLLKALLQLMVPVQQSLAQLSSQMEICPEHTCTHTHREREDRAVNIECRRSGCYPAKPSSWNEEPDA